MQRLLSYVGLLVLLEEFETRGGFGWFGLEGLLRFFGFRFRYGSFRK